MQNESPKDQPQQVKFISKTSCPWDPRTFGGLSAPGAKDCLVGKGSTTWGPTEIWGSL